MVVILLEGITIEEPGEIVEASVAAVVSREFDLVTLMIAGRRGLDSEGHTVHGHTIGAVRSLYIKICRRDPLRTSGGGEHAVIVIVGVAYRCIRSRITL